MNTIEPSSYSGAPTRPHDLGRLTVVGSDETLEALLRHAARAAGIACSDRALRDAVRDHGGSSRRRLVESARALGLRVSAVTTTIAAAIADASPDAPLFVRLGEGSFVALEGKDGSRVRVADVEAGTSELLPDAAVAKSLGLLAVTDETLFFSFEPALPGRPEVPHDHGHGHATPWQRLRALLAVEKKDLLAILGYGVLVGLSALAIPVTAQALVGSIALGTLIQPVVVMALVLLSALAFSSWMRLGQVRLVEALQERLFVHTATRFGQRIVTRTNDALHGEHGPELMNRFFDVLTVQKAAAALLLDGLAIALQLVVGLGLLAFYHPLLLAFDVVLILAIAFVLFPLGSKGPTTAVKESKAKYAVVAWLQELSRHDATFRARTSRTYALDTLDERLRGWLEARRKHFSIVIRQTIGMLAVHTVASASVLALGAWLVIDRRLTLGQLVAAELVVNSVVAGVSKLGKYVETTYDLLAAVDKIGHIDDIVSESDAGVAPGGEGAIGVSCELHGTTVSAAPGERVAVVRPPHGATEIVDHVLGHASDANVRIDGVPLVDFSLSAYREDLAVVRDAEVFAGTLLDNVRAGRDVPLVEVRRALAATRLDDVAAGLPSGVHSSLGTHGTPLSRDEAMRLTIARALAARPRFLVLDGALDGLAPKTRRAIAEELDRRRATTTTLVTTHHPDVVALCDRALHVPSVLSEDPS